MKGEGGGLTAAHTQADVFAKCPLEQQFLSMLNVMVE